MIRVDWPFVAPWNMFSSRKWTPEVIRFHQTRMLFALLAVPMLVTSFILLDWIW